MSKYGVLLAVSSLPGSHGIGDFGKSAFQFIDWLKKHDYSYWQILPLNPIGPGHSPYMSTCSEAIDPRYISLDELVKEKLIVSVKKIYSCSSRVNYEKVWSFKEKYLKEVFKADSDSDKIQRFENDHPWVRQYAIFTVLKKKFNNSPWSTWTDIDDYSQEECLFEIWCQMKAYEQWNKVREYAAKQNIQIIADCPFYVGLESVDCWAHKDEFMLDENYHPTLVSGCPPDVFSEDGQLWGTPIYNFDKMRENRYSFLINRLAHLSKTCDILRLDHFRAFDTYCVIPVQDTNARRGEWRVGPRYDFFDELFRQYPNISLIAEDLGDIFQSVHDLRDHYQLPGMYVSEFMVFDENLHSNENQIVYPGTHDNDTIKGWLKSLSKEQKQYLRKKFGSHYLSKSFKQYVWNQSSKITIFLLQDLLNLGRKARMNFPGTMGSPNWEWKLKTMSQLCWPSYWKAR